MLSDVLWMAEPSRRCSTIPGFLVLNLRVLEDTESLPRWNRLLLKRQMRRAVRVVETIEPGLLVR